MTVVLPAGVRVGGLGLRFVAFVIDWLPLTLIGGAAGWFVRRTDQPDVLVVTLAAAGVLLLGWLLICWWLLATRGATPGLRAVRLHAVRLADGRPLGWGRALLRTLVLVLCLSIAPVGLVMVVLMAVNKLHQGWHDLAVGSVVVSEERPAPAATPDATPGDDTEDDTEDDDADDEQDVGSARPRGQQVDWNDAPSYVRGRAVAGPSSLAPAASGDRDAWGRPLGTDPEPDPAPVLDDDTAQNPIVRSQRDGWWLDLGDDHRVDLGPLVLIGRNPQSRTADGEAVLVPVAPDSRTVSKTHLALGVDERGPWVMDRGSTNGSSVASGLGTNETLPAGVKVRVGAGQEISFGEERLTLRRD